MFHTLNDDKGFLSQTYKVFCFIINYSGLMSIDDSIESYIKESRKGLRDKNLYIAESRMESAESIAILTGTKFPSSYYTLRKDVYTFSAEQHFKIAKNLIEKGHYDLAAQHIDVSENRADIAKMDKSEILDIKRSVYKKLIKKRIRQVRKFMKKGNLSFAMMGLSEISGYSAKGGIELPKDLQDLLKDIKQKKSLDLQILESLDF